MLSVLCVECLILMLTLCSRNLSKIFLIFRVRLVKYYFLCFCVLFGIVCIFLWCDDILDI